MKLICLNIWAGVLRRRLINFLKANREDIDIFCLQEVWSNRNRSQFPIVFKGALKLLSPNILGSIQKALLDFDLYFAPTNSGMIGPAIFIKNSITIERAGDMFVCRFPEDPKLQNQSETLGKKLQYIEFVKGKKTFTVFNLHGLWDRQRGLDTDLRLEQSHTIRKYLTEARGAKILCGDFNLFPETKSLRILEEGMRNLVKEFGFKSTKNHLGLGDSPGRIVDYILVSPEVEVKDFKVIQKNVSDHLPLFLEFS